MERMVDGKSVFPTPVKLENKNIFEMSFLNKIASIIFKVNKNLPSPSPALLDGER